VQPCSHAIFDQVIERYAPDTGLVLACIFEANVDSSEIDTAGYWRCQGIKFDHPDAVFVVSQV